MSGAFLLSFTWAAISVSLIGIVIRIVALSRLPAHLRWELAPIPRERGKGSHGGSYLEEYEWWKKPRETSGIDSLIFMFREIFLMRSVRRHNPSLWPFSLAMHLGIYFFIGSLFLHIDSVILLLINPRVTLPEVFGDAVSLMAFCGCLSGSAGSIGLLLKRVLDKDLRWSNNSGRLLNLVFLAAVFVSGAYAWIISSDGMSAAGSFIEKSLTFDSNVRINFPYAAHVALFLAFCAYLPFTGMTHFIAKYFTFHRILWDDQPLDARLERELNDLLSRPVSWAARHAGGGRQKNWVEIVEEIGDEKTRP